MGGTSYLYREVDDENWESVDLHKRYERLRSRTEQWVRDEKIPPKGVFEALEGSAKLLYGQDEESIRAIHQMAIDAGYTDWYLRLANSYVVDKKVFDAQQVLGHFIERYHSRTADRNEWQAVYEAIESFWRTQGFPLLAAKLFEKFAEHDLALYRRIAAIYARGQDYETAELVFEDAIARNGAEPLDLIPYAKLLITLQRYDEAVALVDQSADAIDAIDVYSDPEKLVVLLTETQIELYQQLARRAKIQGQHDLELNYLFLEVSARERDLITTELRRLNARTVTFLEDDRVEEAEALLAHALDAGQPWVSELYEAFLTRLSAPPRKGLRSRLPAGRRQRRAIGSMIETAENMAEDRAEREEAATDTSFLHLPPVPLVSTGARVADLAFTADGAPPSDDTLLADVLPPDNCLNDLVIERLDFAFGRLGPVTLGQITKLRVEQVQGVSPLGEFGINVLREGLARTGRGLLGDPGRPEQDLYLAIHRGIADERRKELERNAAQLATRGSGVGERGNRSADQVIAALRARLRSTPSETNYRFLKSACVARYGADSREVLAVYWEAGNAGHLDFYRDIVRLETERNRPDEVQMAFLGYVHQCQRTQYMDAQTAYGQLEEYWDAHPDGGRDRAIELFAEVVRKDASLWRRIGRRSEAVGDDIRARDAYEKAVNRSAVEPEDLLALAKFEIKAQNPERSLGLLDGAIRITDWNTLRRPGEYKFDPTTLPDTYRLVIMANIQIREWAKAEGDAAKLRSSRLEINRARELERMSTRQNELRESIWRFDALSNPEKAIKQLEQELRAGQPWVIPIYADFLEEAGRRQGNTAYLTYSRQLRGEYSLCHSAEMPDPTDPPVRPFFADAAVRSQGDAAAGDRRVNTNRLIYDFIPKEHCLGGTLTRSLEGVWPSTGVGQGATIRRLSSMTPRNIQGRCFLGEETFALLRETLAAAGHTPLGDPRLDQRQVVRHPRAPSGDITERPRRTVSDRAPHDNRRDRPGPVRQRPYGGDAAGPIDGAEHRLQPGDPSPPSAASAATVAGDTGTERVLARQPLTVERATEAVVPPHHHPGTPYVEVSPAEKKVTGASPAVGVPDKASAPIALGAPGRDLKIPDVEPRETQDSLRRVTPEENISPTGNQNSRGVGPARDRPGIPPPADTGGMRR